MHTRSMTAHSLKWPTFFLGLTLGGFFDGILLHQILEWHHLLSNVDAARDMRTQLLADGVFHALMYVIAVIALLQLWKRRGAMGVHGTDRSMGGWALLGFGTWHVLDAVLSHWILGIHRIRMDSPNPLVWDLVWFVVFGLAPMVLGWQWLHRARGDGGGGGTGRGHAVAASLALAAVVAGPLAALPAAGNTGQTLVVFAPGVSPGAAFDALAQADARVVWVDASGGLWAVTLSDPGHAWDLYRSGALMVSGSAIAMGCFGWSRPV